jgi:hypothetical protein
MRVTGLRDVADAPRVCGPGPAWHSAGGLEAAVGRVGHCIGHVAGMSARQAWELIECGRRARSVGSAAAAGPVDAAIPVGSARAYRRFGLGIGARSWWHG